MPDKADQLIIGSAWKNKTNDGKVYLSVRLNDIRLFPVKEKKGENSPDYVVMGGPKKTKPKEDNHGEADPF